MLVELNKALFNSRLKVIFDGWTVRERSVSVIISFVLIFCILAA
jgi:hypothetical protein